MGITEYFKSKQNTICHVNQTKVIRRRCITRPQQARSHGKDAQMVICVREDSFDYFAGHGKNKDTDMFQTQ